MDIKEFIDKVAEYTNSKYIVFYRKDYKWYVVVLQNPFILESFIITERVLNNKDKCYKRIELIKKYMEVAEIRYDERQKMLMED